MNIKKRDSTAILNSLNGGVVPNRGLEYIIVGRVEEAQQILNDLQTVRKGASIIKFFIGSFGSGKSFIQALIHQIAFKEKFVVTKADFTPERRLYGTDRKAVATYTELIKNMTIATSPDGNALPRILDKWITDIQNKVVSEKNYESISFNDNRFVEDVQNAIKQSIDKMDDLVGGFSLSRILCLYYQGFIEDRPELQRSVIRWLRGEYHTKTEAKNDLGVNDIIDDYNYYNYLKLISQFVKQVGYSGLVVNLDEAINLYKITHSQTRDKNYEVILKIYNDTLQGNLEGLYITFCGTPEFLEDERRGLYSYGALKRRLQSNRFENSQFRDLSQPVIKLTPLKHEETYVLLQKLRDIHAIHYEYDPSITDDQLMTFIQKEYSMLGAEDNLTIGQIVPTFIGVMNIAEQNKDFDLQEVFQIVKEKNEKANIESRFRRTTQ